MNNSYNSLKKQIAYWRLFKKCILKQMPLNNSDISKENKAKPIEVKVSN